MARKKIAVNIARQQIFTKGHEYGLLHCTNNYDATISLVGSAFKARDIKNPFTYQERASILDVWYKGRGAAHAIRPLRDQLYNNAKWNQSVQETVNQALAEQWGLTPKDCDITIVGSDRDATTWYLKAFPQWGRDLLDPDPRFVGLAATHLRRRLWEGANPRSWEELPDITKNFLELWAATDAYADMVAEYEWLKSYWEKHNGPYGMVAKTVDATIVQSGHVLVVKRARRPGKNLVAVPGGFVKQHQTMLDALVEEVVEETGLLLAEGKRAKEITKAKLLGSIVAQREFDHPDRDFRGRIFTTNYLIRLDDTQPLPNVSGQLVPMGELGGGVEQETSDAWFMSLDEARSKSHIWYGDHHGMLDTMLGLIRD